MLKYLRQNINRAALVLGLLAGWAGLSGCESPDVNSSPNSPATADAGTNTTPTSSLILKEGDTVRISFPGAPTLDSTQTIRRDGKITLDTGEMKAAGLTPAELEQQVLKAFFDQLVVKQVSVVVQGSTFVVYVLGSVQRPGKIVSERVETPLQAVIEAGLDSSKSNLKKVKVIRENDNGTPETFYLNLDDVMKGRKTKPFTLKSYDEIFVPEKFSWY